MEAGGGDRAVTYVRETKCGSTPYRPPRPKYKMQKKNTKCKRKIQNAKDKYKMEKAKYKYKIKNTVTYVRET